jgi:hypothetical protein
VTVKCPTKSIGCDTAHICEFEFVPDLENAKEIYIIFDGERIAYRGKPGTRQAKNGCR